MMAVPIGRPIDNTEVYVLDENFEPVPIGVPGQLFIGGRNLARGYLQRADLTADRFVPHPFSAKGARLYRTGDIARWLPTGDLDYAGRVDGQVKLRGVRIEPGEVESQLRDHPNVREAAVLLRRDAGAEPLLAMYIVPRRVRPRRWRNCARCSRGGCRR